METEFRVYAGPYHYFPRRWATQQSCYLESPPLTAKGAFSLAADAAESGVRVHVSQKRIGEDYILREWSTALRKDHHGRIRFGIAEYPEDGWREKEEAREAAMAEHQELK